MKNTQDTVILGNIANIDVDETESDNEAFAAPPAPELELTKATMLPFKDHKFGRVFT